jgi:hypothetical protein
MSDNSVRPGSDRRPRLELPEEAFAVWAPELPALADEIIAAIGREVPDYSRPLAAEALFAYIDELSAESAEGYTREQAARAGEADRRRADCIALLVQEPPPPARALDAASVAAGWTVPAEVALLVWSGPARRRPIRRLPLGSIAAAVDGVWCAAIPDPSAPGRRAEVERALAGVPAGLGTAVPLADAARSLRRARAALELAESMEGTAFVASDEHRAALLLQADPGLVEELALVRLAPLDLETPRSRQRLTETLLAWLRNEGNASAAGEELGVHGQTVRYRLARLRELFGSDLDDPDVRFELELVLRAGT